MSEAVVYLEIRQGGNKPQESAIIQPGGLPQTLKHLRHMMKFLAGGALVLDGRRFMRRLFQFRELGRLLLKMTPLHTETASNGSGCLPFMRAPKGGGTCHNVPPPPVNMPLRLEVGGTPLCFDRHVLKTVLSPVFDQLNLRPAQYRRAGATDFELEGQLVQEKGPLAEGALFK